jgi:3-isopropylmalate/(R)-2-methylmalate dehydratase large subunit|tara:strand:+ start:7700 stop:9001 length:1302 start_codon:yes stop_codon:yes gene_type:complete
MAGLTITEKIMAHQSGRDSAKPGELVWVDINSVMTMDYLGNQTFKLFDSLGANDLFNRDKVICVSDHLVPPPSEKFANLLNDWRNTVKQHNVKYFYDFGEQGIAHQIMVEDGHVLPGTVSVGTDSHANSYGAVGAVGNAVSVTDAAVAMATGKGWFRVPESVKFSITGEWQPWVMGKDLSLHIMNMMHWNGDLIYKALEYTGPAIQNLSMAGRITLCNMTVDLGAKNGIIAPDERTKNYLSGVAKGEWEMITSDPDAAYEAEYEIDVTNMGPVVSKPDKLDDVVSIEEVVGTKITQVFIGTCTNGRVEDFGITAAILEGKTVHPSVNMLMVPASQTQFLEAMEKGYVSTLVKAGVAIGTSGCAPCFGTHRGVAGDGDVILSAGNRNMQGRMGSKSAQIYLTSPAVCAASALAGVITDPRDLPMPENLRTTYGE